MVRCPAAFQEIATTFGRLDDWEDRYRYIIELGEALPRLAENEKTEANRIHGCVSQVWLVPIAAQCGGQMTITFRGESDSMIVQGLVAVLLALYSGRPAAEIFATNAIASLDALGFREHLTTQRSNGVIAIVNRIRAEARIRRAT